jgi:hypothetical protein
MQQPEPPVRKPSLFVAGLVGYLAATAVGVLVTLVLASGAKGYDNVAAFQLLVCLGALGAYTGYLVAVKRRKALGVSGPSDEWRHFFGSTAFSVLALIVLGGSLGISTLVALIYDAVVGPPIPR